MFVMSNLAPVSAEKLDLLAGVWEATPAPAFVVRPRNEGVKEAEPIITPTMRRIEAVRMLDEKMPIADIAAWCGLTEAQVCRLAKKQPRQRPQS